MHEKRIKIKRNLFLIIGFFFLLLGIILIILNFAHDYEVVQEESQAIENFYIQEDILEEELPKNESLNEVVETRQNNKKNKVNYIAILKIPKIGVKRGLVDPDSYLNNINYNLEWIDGSSMPDEENGSVIIAGHSGTARVSYFRKLDKLVIGDVATIDYKGKTYTYKVISIYEIKKTGKAEIRKEQNISTLTLITCKHNTNKQIIVMFQLI